MQTNIDAFDSLLKQQHGVVNSLRDTHGYTLLMRSASEGRKDIVSLLAKRAPDLSVVAEDGKNVLKQIVLDNHEDDVSLEMLSSFDVTQLSSDIVNQKDASYNRTPLHHAAWFNKHKTIVWLLDHGADPLVKDHLDRSPAEQCGCDKKTRTLIRFFRK